jgi:hypothetical protein
MKINTFTFLMFISVLMACNNEKKRAADDHMSYSYMNTGDKDSHWIGQQSNREVPNAHSGSIVSLLDEQHPYGMGFRRKVNQLPDTNIKRVIVTGWVNYPDTTGAKCSLIFSADLQEKNLKWLGYSIEKENKITPNQWTFIHKEFDYPNGLTGKEELSIYFWNNSKMAVLVDDMEVIFER